MVAGAYLLVVGLLAKLVSALGAAGWFPLVTFSIVMGGLGVGLLFLSDRVRQRVKQFVSRNFRRPFHDYRTVWASFTERTATMVTESDFGREVAKLIAETFEVLSASIWLVDEDSKEFRCVASTAMESEAGSNSLERVPAPTELVSALVSQDYPFHLESGTGVAMELLGKLVPEHFRKGGGRLCLPLRSGGEFLGTLMLGDRVSGVSFSVDDFDLLKCIGDHVAARLRNLRLSDRLVQAKEMEAFQTMSAFFVHDLKNTASTLSLMLQNMARHFDDPAFREDAMRGLGRSVEHINQLVAELTVLRQKLDPRWQNFEVEPAVRELTGRLDWSSGVRLHLAPGGAGVISADPAMMEKVFTNLVINAREAVGATGEVWVRTGRLGEWAYLEVEDNGPGMNPDFVRQSLFKPFRTTKKKGLGIGLFHCKMMVEVHRGRIEVQTAPGKGTLVRVLLPHQR
jgi:putative PEP-CTERM system histidine kinase